MRPIFKSDKEFIIGLPNINKKELILKSIALVLFGFLLSFIAVILWMIFIDQNAHDDNIWWLSRLFVQNIPIFLMCLLLFYRGKLAEIRALFREFSLRKHFSSRIITFFLLFVISISLNLIAYYTSDTNAMDQFLLEYTSRGAEISEVDLGYFFQFTLFGFGMFVIAFFEEFIFRFTLFRHYRRYGLWIALLVSITLFVLMHSAFSVSLIIAGIVFALYYEKTNDFWGAVILHALENIFIVYYSYYALSLFVLS